MAKQKVKISGLSKAVEDILSDYQNNINVQMADALKEAGKAGQKEVKSLAPVDTGKYKKSWRTKYTQESAHKGTVEVYAGGHQYSLTHLLEHGHAFRNGGRAKAYPHIAPAQELAEKEFETKFRHLVEGGM